MANSRRKPWRKTLYGNEGYPDNYTDPKFLKDLQKNINVQLFEFPEAVLGATKLTHQISLVVAFILLFKNLYVQPHFVQPEIVLIGCGCSAAVGYFIHILLNYSARGFSCLERFQLLRDDMKTVISVLLFGYIMSPLLHTLTKSISTDTIFTVTFFVFLLHLICFDYGMPASIVSNAISLNAVVFGALCLASRLRTSFHAFVLLVVTVELFALYPHILRSLEKHSTIVVRVTTTSALAIFNSLCLIHISTPLFVTNALMLIFCGFIYPFIFCYVQKFKNNIHGPWDEAVVDVKMD